MEIMAESDIIILHYTLFIHNSYNATSTLLLLIQLHYIYTLNYN